jgi:hypothetical protein
VELTEFLGPADGYDRQAWGRFFGRPHALFHAALAAAEEESWRTRP